MSVVLFAGEPVLLLSYWTVLVAELVGDKSLYNIASLAGRLKPARVLVGVTAAFSAKIGVAVVFGTWAMPASSRWTDVVSAIVFFAMAWLLWRKRARTPSAYTTAEIEVRGGIAVAFCSIFFTEWADKGQMSAAALAAAVHHPALVWIGATAALFTKALLAIAVGWKLRKWLRERTMRTIASFSYGVLGLATLYDATFRP